MLASHPCRGSRNTPNHFLLEKHVRWASWHIYKLSLHKEVYTKVHGTKVLDSIRNLFLTNAFQNHRDFLIHEFLFVSPTGVTKGFIKGEALRLLRTNFSQFSLEENISNFKTRL